MQEKVKQYKDYLRKADAFDHAVGVLYYDFETVMPKGAADHFSKTMGTLSEEMYKMETSPELKALVTELYEHRDELDEITRREVEEHREQIARIECIPMEEYVAYSELESMASAVWHQAKVDNDYESFKPYLQKIVDYQRKFALYYAPDKEPYDTLLDQYEKGLNKETLDAFFGKLREAFKPLVEKTSAARDSIRDDFLSRNCPVEQQRKLSDYP